MDTKKVRGQRRRSISSAGDEGTVQLGGSLLLALFFVVWAEAVDQPLLPGVSRAAGCLSCSQRREAETRGQQAPPPQHH